MINNVSLRDATLYTERSGRTDAVKFRMVRFCVFAYYTVGIYSEKLTPVWCSQCSVRLFFLTLMRSHEFDMASKQRDLPEGNTQPASIRKQITFGCGSKSVRPRYHFANPNHDLDV